MFANGWDSPQAITAIIALVISLCSLGYNIYNNVQQNRLSNRVQEREDYRTNLATVSVESTLNKNINDSQGVVATKLAAYANIKKTIGDNPRQPKLDQLRITLQELESAFEIYLNHYEMACNSYLRGAVDKINFRRHHEAGIKRIVGERLTDGMKNFDEFHRNVNFQAIKKVFDEWTQHYQ